MVAELKHDCFSSYYFTNHFYPADLYLYRDYSNLFSLLIIVLAAGAPFFFGGICIGYIISNAGSAINSVYFADLAGAATGCLLALVLINYLGAIASCFAVAVIAMAVAAFSSRHNQHGIWEAYSFPYY